MPRLQHHHHHHQRSAHSADVSSVVLPAKECVAQQTAACAASSPPVRPVRVPRAAKTPCNCDASSIAASPATTTAVVATPSASGSSSASTTIETPCTSPFGTCTASNLSAMPVTALPFDPITAARPPIVAAAAEPSDLTQHQTQLHLQPHRRTRPFISTLHLSKTTSAQSQTSSTPSTDSSYLPRANVTRRSSLQPTTTTNGILPRLTPTAKTSSTLPMQPSATNPRVPFSPSSLSTISPPPAFTMPSPASPATITSPTSSTGMSSITSPITENGIIMDHHAQNNNNNNSIGNDNQPPQHHHRILSPSFLLHHHHNAHHRQNSISQQQQEQLQQHDQQVQQLKQEYNRQLEHQQQQQQKHQQEEAELSIQMPIPMPQSLDDRNLPTTSVPSINSHATLLTVNGVGSSLKSSTDSTSLSVGLGSAEFQYRLPLLGSSGAAGGPVVGPSPSGGTCAGAGTGTTGGTTKKPRESPSLSNPNLFFDTKASLRKTRIQFNQVLPNFISKHVREWCDRIVYPPKSSPQLPNHSTNTYDNERASLSTQQQTHESSGQRGDPDTDSEVIAPVAKSPTMSFSDIHQTPHVIVSSISQPSHSQHSENSAIQDAVPTSPSMDELDDTSSSNAYDMPPCKPGECKHSRVNEDSPYGPKPSIEESFAAVVMADVSGYSSLTSALAERDPSGAEILGKVMKRYLDHIIQVILLHGGDIVKFVGDAVIFYWKITPDLAGLPVDIARGEVVLKAAICCLDLLKRLGTFNIDIPDFETRPLRIHLGIGAGDVIDVHVGGYQGNFEHFIAGDAMNQLVHVLNIAAAGELAMSHTARGCLAAVVDFSTLDIGMYNKKCIILTGLESASRKVPPPGDDTRQSLYLWDIAYPNPNLCMYKSFISPSALFKLKSDIDQSFLFGSGNGVNDILSSYELRQVTTLFINIGSLQHWDNTTLLRDAQCAMVTAQKALHKYEGVLRQFHVDDKGAVILCFFGLPPFSHENDSSYGIRAGMQICEDFSKMFSKFSIGITTGVVSIGGVGNSVRTEYAVMGDSINMAARIMCQQQAHRSVICDERTYSLCTSLFEFDGLGEVLVKGKSRPINIFRVKAERHPQTINIIPRLHTKMVVGREKERRAIFNMFNDHNPSSSIIFEGESGQGTSTLARLVRSEATKFTYFPIVINCSEVDDAKPLQFELMLLTQLFMLVNNLDRPYNETLAVLESYYGSADTPGGRRRYKEKNTSSDGFFSSEDSASNNQGTASSNDYMSSNSGRYDVSTLRIATNGTVSRDSVTINGTSLANGNTSKDSTSLGFDASDHVADSGNLPIFASVTTSSSMNDSSMITNNTIGRADDELAKTINGIFTADDLGLSGSYEARIFRQECEKALKILGLEKQYQYLRNLSEVVYGQYFTYLDMFKGRSLPEFLLLLVKWLLKRLNLVIIVDELHCLNLRSLCQMLPLCEHVNVVMTSLSASRFSSDENVNVYHRLKRARYVQFFHLEGLDFRSSMDMMKNMWNVALPTVSAISPNLALMVYERTSGNPLYIKTVINALRDSGLWRISENGVLMEQADLYRLGSDVFKYDIKSAFVSQFDRLDPTFQIFLKIASVFGDRFMLDDMHQFISCISGWDIPADKKEAIPYLINKITACDKYGFLVRHAGNKGWSLSFKSMVIKDYIYSMMVVSKRQKLHLLMANHFEKKFSETGQKTLLITIFNHYYETDNRQRFQKLRYLEAVCHLFYQQGQMKIAVKYYLALLKTAMQVQLDIGYALYDDLTVAIWHCELGQAFLQLGSTTRGGDYLLKALELLKFKIPKSKVLMNYRYYHSFMKIKSILSFIEDDKDRQANSKTSILARYEQLLKSSGLPHHQRYKLCKMLWVSSEVDEDIIRDKDLYKYDNLESETQYDILETENPLFQTFLGETDSIMSKEDKHLFAILSSPDKATDFNVMTALAFLSDFYSKQGDIVRQRYCAITALQYAWNFPRASFFGSVLTTVASSIWKSEGKRSVGHVRRLLDYADDYDSCYDAALSSRRVFLQSIVYYSIGDFETAALKLDSFLQTIHVSSNMHVLLEGLAVRITIAFMNWDMKTVHLLSGTMEAISDRMDSSVYKCWSYIFELSIQLQTMDYSYEYATRIRSVCIRLLELCFSKHNLPNYLKVLAFCNVWQVGTRLYRIYESLNSGGDNSEMENNHQENDLYYTGEYVPSRNHVYTSALPGLPRVFENMHMMILDINERPLNDSEATESTTYGETHSLDDRPGISYIYTIEEGFNVLKEILTDCVGKWQWMAAVSYLSLTMIEISNFFITHPNLLPSSSVPSEIMDILTSPMLSPPESVNSTYSSKILSDRRGSSGSRLRRNSGPDDNFHRLSPIVNRRAENYFSPQRTCTTENSGLEFSKFMDAFTDPTSATVSTSTTVSGTHRSQTHTFITDGESAPDIIGKYSPDALGGPIKEAPFNNLNEHGEASSPVDKATRLEGDETYFSPMHNKQYDEDVNHVSFDAFHDGAGGPSNASVKQMNLPYLRTSVDVNDNQLLALLRTIQKSGRLDERSIRALSDLVKHCKVLLTGLRSYQMSVMTKHVLNGVHYLYCDGSISKAAKELNSANLTHLIFGFINSTIYTNVAPPTPSDGPQK